MKYKLTSNYLPKASDADFSKYTVHNRDMDYLGFKFLEISIAVFKQHKKCMHQQPKYLQNFLLENQIADELK